MQAPDIRSKRFGMAFTSLRSESVVERCQPVLCLSVNRQIKLYHIFHARYKDEADCYKVFVVKSTFLTYNKNSDIQ